MEHDDRDELDILRGSDEPDSDVDFEDYLKEKDKVWTTPVSELPIRHVPVASAVDASSNGQGSPETESEESSLLPDAADADKSAFASQAVEHVTSRELRPHPVAGHYVVERSEQIHYDEEWIAIYNACIAEPAKWREIAVEKVIKPLFDSTQFNVLEYDAEKVILHMNKMERAFFLLRAISTTFPIVLEDFLKAETAERRMQLLELGKKERAKVHKPKDSAKSKVAKKAPGRGKSPAAKSIDSYLVMGFDKDKAIEYTKAKGLLDEAALAYIEKVYAV